MGGLPIVKYFVYQQKFLVVCGPAEVSLEEFAHFCGPAEGVPMYVWATVLNLPWPDGGGGKLL